jgi:hypothetical protein
LVLNQYLIDGIRTLEWEIRGRFNSLEQVEQFSNKESTTAFQIARTQEYITYKSNFGGQLFIFEGLEILGKIVQEHLIIGSIQLGDIAPKDIESKVAQLSNYLGVRSVSMALSPSHPFLKSVRKIHGYKRRFADRIFIIRIHRSRLFFPNRRMRL